MTRRRFLQMALKAQEQVGNCEKRLAQARADFQTAVRRLHIEGASLREIARDLGLSHQRVHQLAGLPQKSWWRFWRGELDEPDRSCTFCGHGKERARQLIAGPGILICDSCVDAAETAIPDNVESGQQKIFKLLAENASKRCSFCGKRRRDLPRVAAKNGNICAPRLDICREIVAKERI